MKLYLVRHGETDWNVKKKIQGQTDIPLNRNGVRQARELAAELAHDQGIDVRHIYHSPQSRAAETARICGEALHAECIPAEGLAEMNLGIWEGSNWRIIERENTKAYQRWILNRRYVRIPGGESYNDLLARVLDTMEDIIREEAGEDVLIVTHSAVIMALRCYIAGHPFDEMARTFKTRNAEVIMLESFKILEAIVRFEKEAEHV